MKHVISSFAKFVFQARVQSGAKHYNFYVKLAVLSRDFPGIYSIGLKLEVAIQFKNTFTTQILSQSDNRKQRYSILDHIFGPSSGTLGPIPKKILMDNLPIMAG